MMARAQDGVNSGNLFKKKTNNLGSRRVWPLPGVHNQEDWTSGTNLTRMLHRPGQSRSQNLLHLNGSATFEEPIDYNDRQSFHCAIGWILGMGQCFGLLPLAGVLSESPRNLVFKIFSPRMAYAFVLMMMLFTMAATSFCHVIQTVKDCGTYDDITVASSHAIFYIGSVLRAVLFVWLAPRWPSLQRDWRAMERFLDRNEHQAIRLRWKFSILAATVMIIALLEHILFFVQLIPQEYWLSVSNWTVKDILKYICQKAYPFIFTISNYNLGMGICIIFTNTIETSTLHFMDAFIMLVSMGLAERYKAVNQRLMDKISTSHRNSDWHKLRESYATLSTLVKKVDNNISPTILLSIASNTFFICLQLRNGLSPQETNALETIYFLCCFVNLLGKTVTVMLLGAQINDQSRVALPKLYNCPEAAYNIEAQRLQQQLSTDEVCLTGMGFFSVTRNFILAVAGTIVTYEVLLLNSTSQ